MRTKGQGGKGTQGHRKRRRRGQEDKEDKVAGEQVDGGQEDKGTNGQGGTRTYGPEDWSRRTKRTRGRGQGGQEYKGRKGQEGKRTRGQGDRREGRWVRGQVVFIHYTPFLSLPNGRGDGKGLYRLY